MLATQPDIDTIAITHTFDGIDGIDLKTLQVKNQACQRCLLSYKGCPENASSVKGYSGVRGRS